MKKSNVGFWVIMGLILFIGLVAFTIGHLKNKEPILKTDPPFTQDKMKVIIDSINPNACGDGISIEDCNMDKDHN